MYYCGHCHHYRTPVTTGKTTEFRVCFLLWSQSKETARSLLITSVIGESKVFFGGFERDSSAKVYVGCWRQVNCTLRFPSLTEVFRSTWTSSARAALLLLCLVNCSYSNYLVGPCLFQALSDVSFQTFYVRWFEAWSMPHCSFLR